LSPANDTDTHIRIIFSLARSQYASSDLQKDVEALKNHLPFGRGECVALPEIVTGVGHTSWWYPGSRVMDLDYLNEGTVIGNFVFSGRIGRFPNKHGYHAALFMGFAPRSQATGERSGIIVMDQWIGRRDNRVLPRTIRAFSAAEAKQKRIKPSDNANEFYVVQK
jgi:hypothetical protein